MTDKRAEEVNDVVGMYNIGALGLAGGLGGIGPKGADQAVNNYTDLGVVEERVNQKSFVNGIGHRWCEMHIMNQLLE